MTFCYAMTSFCCDLILDVHYDIITSEMTYSQLLCLLQLFHYKFYYFWLFIVNEVIFFAYHDGVLCTTHYAHGGVLYVMTKFQK